MRRQAMRGGRNKRNWRSGLGHSRLNYVTGTPRGGFRL